MIKKCSKIAIFHTYLKCQILLYEFKIFLCNHSKGRATFYLTKWVLSSREIHHFHTKKVLYILDFLFASEGNSFLIFLGLGLVPFIFTYYNSCPQDFLWEILLQMVIVPIHLFQVLEISNTAFMSHLTFQELWICHDLTFLACHIFYFKKIDPLVCQVIQDGN